LIGAGITGLTDQTPVPNALDVNPAFATAKQLAGCDVLPNNLKEAIDAAKQSTLIAQILSEKTAQKYFETKEAEWSAYCDAQDKDAYKDSIYFYDL
jgi:glutamine synthetase